MSFALGPCLSLTGGSGDGSPLSVSLSAMPESIGSHNGV